VDVSPEFISLAALNIGSLGGFVFYQKYLNGSFKNRLKALEDHRETDNSLHVTTAAEDRAEVFEEIKKMHELLNNFRSELVRVDTTQTHVLGNIASIHHQFQQMLDQTDKRINDLKDVLSKTKCEGEKI